MSRTGFIVAFQIDVSFRVSFVSTAANSEAPVLQTLNSSAIFNSEMLFLNLKPVCNIIYFSVPVV
jgi:hypothetical protein